jgi:hypothetical protein
MTVEEMQAQLDKMKDDIEHMKVRVSEYEHMISVIKAQDDEPIERVPKNDMYFLIGITSGKARADTSYEDNDEIDDARFDNNNYFKTCERAQEVADKINFLLKLERLHDRFCPEYVPDWKTCTGKWSIYFNSCSNIYDYCVTLSSQNEQQVYFPTEEITKKVCDILNKEREGSENE